ncbi:E3 ubiquitin-protein ligase RNF212B-like [Apostichopus japonicus]|uniref:E3 ubiquitin-protein ligase RNF212B-like n=1 Tax=Stichopus japonicus TaxID=307972 RepID=UPI003AB21FA9
MADWVHCNSCFHQPGDGRQFSLTNCGHLYCGECLEDGTRDSCKMCGNHCTAIPLSSKMKPEVEVFFNDPSDIIKKSLKQLIEVMDFQRNHRKRLAAYHRERYSQQAMHASLSQRQIEETKRLEREAILLREENAKLRSMVNAGKSPGSSICNRVPTPGRTMHSSSPTSLYQGRSPSPNKSRKASSPYSTSKSPYANMHPDLSRLQLQNKTPQGPARLSVRTPPVDGKIGTVGTQVSIHSSMSRSSSISSSKGRKTPNGLEFMRSGHSPSPNRTIYQTPRALPRTISPTYSLGPMPHSRSDTPQNSQVMYPQKRPLSCGVVSSYMLSQP